MTKDYAESENLEVGGRVSLTTPAGEERTLVVRGIYDPPQAKQLLGPISMTQQGFDEAFTQPKNSYTFIDADASAAAPLEAATKGLGDANTTSAPSSRRTPPRTWPRCWRCSTCCWASRSS